MAIGYTSGDPGKVSVAGDTMTGPLVLPGAPSADLHAATKAYVDQGGEGGVPTSRQILAGTGLTGGGDLTADRTLTADVGTSAGQVAAGDHTHPTGPAALVVADTGHVTTGNITVEQADWIQLGPDLTIEAAAGDVLELAPSCLLNNTGDDCQLDAATRVSGADTNWWSTGGAASRWPGGIAAWYVSEGFTGPRLPARYTVQAGDVVSGEVTVRLYGRATGASSRTLFASSAYPLRWSLTNLGGSA
ncbi:hypothetical protein O7627_24395 [Solwaraspora sp. WMMD1047]|uniref:hypothetical protein n=1 Tax=Solwaraspora sp. WMMD1047 TaxID=3016102 RepID=UPI002417BAD6|nr:hypothetical protein [Solwaraspora sp. WMMD1047]MDG4832424.1 hypothetical protein [Solwaraspora sp. WMMD1047]